MSNEDRKVSLAEVRAALEKWNILGFQDDGTPMIVTEKIMAELTKPRLKPDCVVTADGPCVKNEPCYAVSLSRLNTNVRKYVPADRVVEWAQEWHDNCETNQTVPHYFADRIREATEVSE